MLSNHTLQKITVATKGFSDVKKCIALKEYLQRGGRGKHEKVQHPLLPT